MRKDIATKASNLASHVGGKYNKEMTAGTSANNTTGDAFVIGNGINTSTSSNAFRVTYAGAVYGLSAFNSTGADYAEYFEWSDGNTNNEDRVGYFVTLDGKKIRIANPDDYILGIVSGQPCIIGNADEDWLGRWEHDEFGRFIIEDVDTPITEWWEVQVPILDDKGNPIQQTKMELQEETITNEDGKTETIIKEVLVPVTDDEGNPVYETRLEMQEFETGEINHGWRHKANPEYDNTQQYIERKDRPEWSAVGMLGVLSVRDDGTCVVNVYCKVNDGGIATAASDELTIQDGKIVKAYRVIERVSDNVVKVVFR